jgi:hypothetical protein
VQVKHPKFQNNHPSLKKAGVTIDQLVIRELQRLGYNLQVAARQLPPGWPPAVECAAAAV